MRPIENLSPDSPAQRYEDTEGVKIHRSLLKTPDSAHLRIRESYLGTGFKTYALRRGRMTGTQKSDYDTLAGRFCVPFAPDAGILDFEIVFGNPNPVVMEIGFGMGTATSRIAMENPQTNYLGIEVHTPGVARLLGDIRRNSIGNIKIIEHDALEVCQAMIAPESLAGIHVFFPDPWPKKRHHKRRLITLERLAVIVPCLSRGGYFYMVTDWEEYARHALETLGSAPRLRNSCEGFAQKQSWRPETKFEMRGKNESRAIWELYFIKE
ncbi:MAG: tRNA (guanosine(46)-N7)-methyltransferase TrmB [Treponemataceae bacterium]|nr:MAG: tRNA (guanosine(46)-N7)-methyltransferase TrmB [Treponemataceae bacterium]